MVRTLFMLSVGCLFGLTVGCSGGEPEPIKRVPIAASKPGQEQTMNLETATFGAGCF